MKTEKNFTLITGSSEGLGRSLAIECASRNMNLILVALPGIELDSTVSFIHRNYNVVVHSYGTDLTLAESCNKLHNWILKKNLKVNMLINNAGIGSSGAFDDYPEVFYKKQIELNVLATTLLTRCMISELKRNRPSYILNVGSLAGFFTMPYKDVYAATKSYVNNFSISLGYELASDGIGVSVLCPGGLNTNLLAIMRNNNHGVLGRLSYITTENTAIMAIDGLLNKQPVIIPGRLNRIFKLINNWMPEFLWNKLVASEFRNESVKVKLQMADI